MRETKHCEWKGFNLTVEGNYDDSRLLWLYIRLVIGFTKKNWRHFFSQSEVISKPVVTRSLTFPALFSRTPRPRICFEFWLHYGIVCVLCDY